LHGRLRAQALPETEWLLSSSVSIQPSDEVAAKAPAEPPSLPITPSRAFFPARMQRRLWGGGYYADFIRMEEGVPDWRARGLPVATE
jgi:hypothetical protein